MSGQSNWSAVLEGPCGVGGSAEGGGGTIKYISIENPPVGTYRIKLTQYFPNYGGMPTAIGYAAGYTGFSKDSASFSYASIYQGANGSATNELSFDLNYLNDFSINFSGSVCANKSVWLPFNIYTIDDCLKTTPFNLSPTIALSIQSQNADLIFYDNASQQSLGKSASVTFGQLSNIKLKLNTPFSGPAENATPSAEINGELRTSTLLVEPSTKNFYLNTDNDNFHLVYGSSKMVTVNATSIGECNESFPDSSVKYNIEITSGSQLGRLKDLKSGRTGINLLNLDQADGNMIFQFIADGIEPINIDTALVRISSSDSNVLPYDVQFIIHAQKIVVQFSPPSIAPGDTSDVILKKKNADGSLTDFPIDQLFDVQITKGANYGTILLPQWGDTTDEAWGVMQGFKFIADKQITESMVESTILVKTSSGIIAGSIQAGNSGEGKTLTNKSIRQLKKTSAVQESDEVLWGEGTITIGGETKIKITLTGPNEVWPYKAVSAGYNSITNFKIKVTNGNQPQPNQSVKTTIARIERSGGHDHPNSSDLTLWGRISINGVKGNPVTAYTDQKGEITTEEVLSSEFGGEYFIEAYLESKPDIKDKVSFIVKVPGLSLLPENSSYTKIGGTDKHFGPPMYQTDNNHWINSNALIDLDSAAVSFSRDHLNKTGIMRINDISLPNGGLFDYRGTLEPPHKSHRVGKDVDIENKNITVLLRVMTRFGWLYIKEPANFYPHFRYVR